MAEFNSARTQLICSYQNATGSARATIVVAWTPDASTTRDPAGACDLGPGEVLKEGVSWKSRTRKVEAAWINSSITLTTPTQEQVLKPLVQALEKDGRRVGAICR